MVAARRRTTSHRMERSMERANRLGRTGRPRQSEQLLERPAERDPPTTSCCELSAGRVAQGREAVTQRPATDMCTISLGVVMATGVKC